MKTRFENRDCMEVMKEYPDNYFDLAVVDPPYGIDVDNRKDYGKKRSVNSIAKSGDYIKKRWDSEVPKEQYFREVFRVSKHQIIWGINYYPYDFLNGGRIFWDKVTPEDFTSADGELAYCSKTETVRKAKIVWNGMIQHNMKEKEIRIHPTQKPIQLYAWIFKNYAAEGMKILDTHLGSGSNAIAAHYAKMGEFVACEIDKDYFDGSMKRFKEQTLQLKAL